MHPLPSLLCERPPRLPPWHQLRPRSRLRERGGLGWEIVGGCRRMPAAQFTASLRSPPRWRLVAGSDTPINISAHP
ncbi:hypothetical protein E2C01_093617 [Portunus trituberculatus]|uniref:Uncharacterized protein n=1 Tax=Portunus trituberculatus TaxID=210409 RepID=A0A5B7JYQ6_PORTR|nr:hypothetical protein [Portunus trituberculatus]